MSGSADSFRGISCAPVVEAATFFKGICGCGPCAVSGLRCCNNGLIRISNKGQSQFGDLGGFGLRRVSSRRVPIHPMIVGSCREISWIPQLPPSVPKGKPVNLPALDRALWPKICSQKKVTGNSTRKYLGSYEVTVQL